MDDVALEKAECKKTADSTELQGSRVGQNDAAISSVSVRCARAYMYLYGFIIPLGSYKSLICFISLIMVSLRL